MSQNKILKDIAIKLGATVGEHVNDTNELLTAIAVALGATPTKKYNNVKDTLELIRDNISEGGSGGSTLKTYLDNLKTCKNMFENYSGDNISDLISYDDTENVFSFYAMFKDCSNATSFPQLDTSDMSFCQSMFQNCSKVIKLDISYYKIRSASNSSKWCAGCKSLKALIIRWFASPFALASDAFDDCYHLNGTVDSTYNPEGLKDCYIYIPRNQISLLEQSTYWSPYASQFRALEDYTVDGTITGEFDDAKAGL